jgi:hypothetical protein
MGELVGMSPSLNNQRSRDEIDRKAVRQPNPEVIVLAHREGLVKPADRLEDLPAEKTGRQTEKAERQHLVKDPSGRLSMFLMGVEPGPASNPDLFSIGYFRPGKGLKESHLNSDFFFFPEVVGIQEGNLLSPSQPQTQVSGSADAPMRLPMIDDSWAIFSDDFLSLVIRAVIDDQELKRMAGAGAFEEILREDRVDRLTQKSRPVIRRDDDRDHITSRPGSSLPA